MSSILFVTFDGGGNVPPMLAVASQLQARGHDIRVMGHPVQAEGIQRAGLRFIGFENARTFRGATHNSPLVWNAMFGDRAMGRDVLAELDARPADQVVIDCLTFGAIEAVAERGIPYVLLEHTFHGYCAGMWLRGPMGVGLRLRRFKTRELVEGAATRLVLALQALDPVSATGQPAENVVHAGPVATGQPADASEPTVLASLSTVNFPGMTKAMQNIIDALAILRVRGLVTTGPAISGTQLRVPNNVEVHDYVPHTELMPKVSLVIGHGGHATTMTALAHDLPLLVMPMHPLLDQKMIGAAVEKAGAGRLLKKTAKPAAIAAAVQELLADGPHREAAALLGKQIRTASGASTGADHLEALVN